MSRPGTNSSPGEIRDFGFSPYDNLKLLVFRDQILCCWLRRFSSKGMKEGHLPPKRRYFTASSSSSVKTVADRNSQALVKVFGVSTLMTLNPQNRGLVNFFWISGCDTFQEWIALKWLEMDQDNLFMKFSALGKIVAIQVSTLYRFKEAGTRLLLA